MDTKLFVRKQKGGMFAVIDKSITTGSIFWVDSTNSAASDSAGFGQNPDAPFATIDYAIGMCTANKGDIIYVMPNHAETVSAAGGIAIDTAGIKIVGLGEGDDRPTITCSATGSTITVSVSNVTVENLVILATAAVVNTVVVTGEYFTMRDCLFIGNAAAQTHKIPIITEDTANDMTLDNVRVQLLVAEDGTTAITTTSSEAVRLVGADRAIIKNCYFSGDFTTSAINGITTASKDVQILNNRIHNVATENIAGGIDLVAACTGHIDGNKVYVAYAVSNTALIDAASCVLGMNYVSNVASELPVLHGTLEAGDVEYQVSVAVSEIGSVGTQTTAVASQATSIATGTVSVGAQVLSAATSIGTGTSVINSQAISIATGAVSLGTQVTAVASQATSIATGTVSVGAQVLSSATSIGTGTSVINSQAISIATGAVSLGTQVTAVASQATSIATGTVSLGTQITAVASQATSIATGVVSVGTGTSVINSQAISMGAAITAIYSMVLSHVS